MADQRFRFLEPIAETKPKGWSPAPRLADLNGKVVGLLDNGKTNAQALLDDIAVLLGQSYQLARVVRERKASYSRVSPKELIDRLAERCDLVLTALGD